MERFHIYLNLDNRSYHTYYTTIEAESEEEAERIANEI